MGLLDSFANLFGFSKSGAEVWMECPDCHERVNLAMDRCPKCGTHIDSMFRLKCPHCQQENPLKAKVCEKCKKPLQLPGRSEGGAPGGMVYTCPRCGYRANYQMTACPQCGVRFV